MSHHYLEFRDVRYTYPHGDEVLRGISFRISHGEHVALLGLNGCGKSTLLLHTNGLLYPDSGCVVVGDIPVTKKTAARIRQTVGLVFQDPDDMLFMPTVRDDIAFGPRNMRLPEEEVSRRVEDSARRVGLCKGLDKPAFQLSGGERRKAAIASVLSMEPDILVLDEPSANLDEKGRRELIDILCGFRHTFLLCTHDFDLAISTCERAIIMADGIIARNIDLSGVDAETLASLVVETSENVKCL